MTRQLKPETHVSVCSTLDLTVGADRNVAVNDIVGKRQEGDKDDNETDNDDVYGLSHINSNQQASEVIFLLAFTSQAPFSR
jgi:hypothetical protein